MCAKYTNHTFQIRLELSYEQALEQVMATLMSDGFGNLRELGMRPERRAVSHIAHPTSATRQGPWPGAGLICQARPSDPETGPCLPHDVILFEEDGKSVVSALQSTPEYD